MTKSLYEILSVTMTAFYVKYFYGLYHGLHVINWVTKCVDADCLVFLFADFLLVSAGCLK